MCSLTGHAQTLMKTVTQQPFQNKQALERGLHNCSVECKAVAHTQCTVGDLLSPVMQPRSVFSYLRRSPAAVSNFAPRKKMCGGVKTSGANTPQSKLPRATLSAVCHSTGLKLPICTCCVQRRGTATPKKSPPVRSVTLQKSPRQAQPILALALSQISWSMLGMKTGGFPNRRPPIEANSPPPSPNQNTLRCR